MSIERAVALEGIKPLLLVFSNRLPKEGRGRTFERGVEEKNKFHVEGDDVRRERMEGRGRYARIVVRALVGREGGKGVLVRSFLEDRKGRG
jgi:hypothetical protein